MVPARDYIQKYEGEEKKKGAFAHSAGTYSDSSSLKESNIPGGSSDTEALLISL